jgi:cytochrome b subunit of formate dehydrogenase
MIGAMGGIETVRIIHRAAAVIFILVTVYHFVLLAYKVWVLRVRMTMLPGLKDVTDMLDAVRYSLGLAQRRPRLPRYNFSEKIEYWSLIWGTILMIVTGFMLWNPIATAGFLPGEFIPAAKTAHSAEALLAVLAVLIWHFYGVHVKTFNRSMFTGRLTREQMEEEHAAELEAIEAGETGPPVNREAKRRRERVFVPAATVLSLVLILVVYTFVTFEQTAITTVPPAEQVQAFVPATPTPTRTPTPTPPATPTPEVTATQEGEVAGEEGGARGGVGQGGTLGNLLLVPHPIEGQEDCLACHGEGAILPFPPDHEGRPSATCLVCHATTEGGGNLPASVGHDLEGRENCLMCHAVDLLPESHKAGSFSNSDCLLCHTPAGSEAPGQSTEPPSSDGGG